ncbi:MerR family transcriptional regulator [Paenibacillus sp. OV219]|uniref:MerR family transcriptional regulator n=1 Tax=Paenibacillus sp. OV219 TaxID=1884377 RepID=UPI0008B2A7F8|nr:MerR family transcriptional regulator [Paenibacillus sp. OV219]SEO61015.1 DNA-binding transcriptional regulator, MerR family [Paenibacillus sp. OV219]
MNGEQLYRSSAFAKKAGVSVRTLQFYDKSGVLSPSSRTASGHRLYREADLAKLQHILALKFLGFSLAELKSLRQMEPQQFGAALVVQKQMLLERRAHLDAVLHAIEKAEKLVPSNDGPALADALTNLIEVMHMELKPSWVAAYLTPDERQTMRQIATESYSPQALQTLVKQPFVEETGRLYRQFREELKRLCEAGVDPGSPEAQSLARQLMELNARRSQGDPEITAGMKRAWTALNALPAAQQPAMYAMSTEEQSFIREASMIMYRDRR